MTCRGVFLPSCVSHIQVSFKSSREPLRFQRVMPCDAMRTFPISEAGGLPAVHFRLEGRSDGLPDLMTSDVCSAWKLKVPLGKPP